MSAAFSVTTHTREVAGSFCTRYATGPSSRGHGRSRTLRPHDVSLLTSLWQIDGSSSHFRYDSGYWTSGSNVYRETVMNGNWGENVKAWGYNYGRYSEVSERSVHSAHTESTIQRTSPLPNSCPPYCTPRSASHSHSAFIGCCLTMQIRLRWRDPHDGGQWTWTNPSGWSSGRSPQSYFNSGRHICCSRVSEVEQRMEWRNSGGRFSNQGCAGRLAIAQCTSSVSCSRWGFHWNNEW